MSLNIKWTPPAVFDTASNPTPFGIYDSDSQFQIQSVQTADWCAKRLGYPIVDIELTSGSFFACFEEAVSEYGAQVNQFNIRNNLDILKGRDNENYTQKLVEGSNLPSLYRIASAYGTSVGVGGNVSTHKGYITLDLTGGPVTGTARQVYNLDTEAYSADSGSYGQLLPTGSHLREITRVYYEALPAITRFFDPYSVGAQGTLNLVSELGFGNYSPAAQFLMMPLYEDLLRMQQIEFNDTIRKSAFTFNIVNNELSVFPAPSPMSAIKKIYFDYTVKHDFDNNSMTVKDNVVADYSNIQYDFIPYADINHVGKQWIRKYTLALSKELLGAIREKYSAIPIPDAEISLDGAALRAEAQVEKDALIEQLRTNLEELSRHKQFEYRKNESDFAQDMLRKVPLKLYVG